MESDKLCVCQGADCENCKPEGETDENPQKAKHDAVLDHPAGVAVVVIVAGTIGVLYGMVAMLFAETFVA